MSRRVSLGRDVFAASLERLTALMEDGHRLVVSFSAGKDSGVTLELAIIAARMTGRLPVDVIMRDEEVMVPGTFEYAERTAQRPEVNFHWVSARQPIINVFNRREPYWWAFDPLLQPAQWVREPPSWIEWIEDKNIDSMTTPARFPPPPGRDLMAVLGLRVQESRGRMYGIFSSGGHVTKANQHGVRNVRPIYDWLDTDIWRAIREYGFDYNRAYDTMFRMGMKAAQLRVGPPTLNQHSARSLAVEARAWPRWFDRVCERLPGVRAVVLFGDRAVKPYHVPGELWESTWHREVMGDNSPAWIKERAATYLAQLVRTHTRHATTPLPDSQACYTCFKNAGSWKALTLALYNGDPFSLKTELPYVEPEYFRSGSGTWGGAPAF